MFNMIKMDLYRLVRSISFWVMIAVIIGITFFTIGMTSLDVDMMRENAASMETVQENAVSTEGEKIVINVGISVQTQAQWVEEVPFSELINENLKSKLLLIVCAIFIPLFINAEYKNGYIKNIAGQLSNRGILIASKVVTVAVQTFIIFAAYVLCAAVVSALFFGDSLSVGGIGDLVLCVALHYFLSFAFGLVILLLTILTKNAALPMTFGILCSAGLTAVLYGGINRIVQVISGSNGFDVSLYMPETNFAYISANMSGEALTRVLLVGFAYAIVAVIFSMVIVKKRDI